MIIGRERSDCRGVSTRIVAECLCRIRLEKNGALWAPRKPLRRNKLERKPADLLHPFAVETYIETFALLFFRDAQADDHVDYLEDDEAADAADYQRRTDGRKLDPDDCVNAADFLDVEESGEDRADDAADAVHAECIQRIVIAEGLLDGRRREEAGDPRRDT